MPQLAHFWSQQNRHFRSQSHAMATMTSRDQRPPLDRRQVAQRSGIDRSNIRRIESGVVVNVTPATMQKLADALDVEVERFYEAHWQTTGQPLPSLPTYFRTKYHDLDDDQIAQIEHFVDHLQDESEDK